MNIGPSPTCLNSLSFVVGVSDVVWRWWWGANGLKGNHDILVRMETVLESSEESRVGQLYMTSSLKFDFP